MADLALTYACEDYDLHRALADGSVHPEGVTIRTRFVDSYERHDRMARNLEYDLAEFSMSAFISARAAGLPLVGLPFFPRRMFVHRYMFVGASTGIRSPKDLEGRRVGIARNSNTLALVARGILLDEHGVDLGAITWVTQMAETLRGTEATGFRFEAAPAGTSLEQLLLAGEIDAMMIPATIASWDRGDPRVARLFPDFRRTEMDFYRKTEIFPIMHVVVARRDLLEREPWLSQALLASFEAAQSRAFERLGRPAVVSLAWARALYEEERGFFGSPPWPVGLQANAAVVESMTRWAHHLGLTTRRLSAAELFADPASVAANA